MKHFIWAIVVLVTAAGFLLESRYALKIHPPVVARIDRFTGDTWIVNSGVWVKITDAPAKADVLPAPPTTARDSSKAEQAT